MIPIVVFLCLYIFFCILVAYAGRGVALGFWGVLFVSICLTPLITAAFIVLFRPKHKKKIVREEYDYD